MSENLTLDSAASSPDKTGSKRDRETALEVDDVFYLLGNDRRRATVSILAEEDRPVDISSLANTLAAADEGSYKSVYVSLQQSHLPQLDEYDVVRYDRVDRTVAPGPAFENVAGYVVTDNGVDRDWRPYIFAALLAVAAVVGASLIPGSDRFIVAGVAAIGILALGGFAAYDVWRGFE